MRSLPLAFVFVVAVGVALAQAPRSYSIDAAPAEYKQAIERAMRAFDSLQSTLSARLLSETKAGGPAHAVGVCRDEAPALTARIAAESGLVLGRTSHKLRNRANEPRPWVKPLLEQAAGRKASTVKSMVVDLGNAVGVVRPIGVAAACTVCHGTDAKRPAPLKAALATQYPTDQAVGFEEGDFRGFFWAEVPKGGGK